MDRDEFIHSINVNLIGTFNVIKSCIPIFKEQNYGRVVNLVEEVIHHQCLKYMVMLHPAAVKNLSH